jgi:hypothetical protein
MKFAYILPLALVAYASQVSAYAKYMPLIPNSDACSSMDHTKSGKLLKFHNDFPKKWSKEFCEADSDGDGFSNGAELGDPCCKWTGSGKPEGKYLSDPISKDSKPADAAAAKCGGGAPSKSPTVVPSGPLSVPYTSPSPNPPAPSAQDPYSPTPSPNPAVTKDACI